MRTSVDSLCIAQSLTVPKEGKVSVCLANLSDKGVVLKAGKPIETFHPLHHASFSGSPFDREVNINQNKKTPRQSSVKKMSIRVDYSCRPFARGRDLLHSIGSGIQ